jgi:protein TonB
VDSANAKSAADKAREIAPAAAISRDEKPSPAAAAKPEAAQPQAAAQPPAPVRPPAATESPRTTARAFAPPTPASRPTSSPIVDAPPAIASNATAPTAVSLPARFAPLPPPAPAAVPTPAASSVPASAQPINVSGNVQATKLTRQVVPVYPAVAKAARVQGTVRFRVIIGTDGQVKSLTTLGGPPPLAQAAADAVRQWRYQPTLVDGKPVEVSTEIDVAFTL